MPPIRCNYQKMTSESDDLLSALMRDSTTHKEAGSMADAVACLYQAKALMLKSPFSYPVEAWCKLPLYLQHAGMFTESMAEFQFLLDDLPRRARNEARLDEPYMGPISDASNKRLHTSMLVNDAETIHAKRALAEKRELKAKPMRQVPGHTVTADEAFEGLFNWFKANPWFVKIDIQTADLTQESAAQQAVLALSADQAAFHRLPPGVQGLAARLVLDFFGKLHATLNHRVWTIDQPQGAHRDLTQLMWLVIAQEIDRASPPPLARH